MRRLRIALIGAGTGFEENALHGKHFHRQVERGAPVEKVARKMEASEAVVYCWELRYGGMNPAEILYLNKLGVECAKRKQLMATR